MTAPPAGQKVVNLALQGGGSHGAFTWGVSLIVCSKKPASFDGSPERAPARSTPSRSPTVWRLAAVRMRAKRCRPYWRKFGLPPGIPRPSALDKVNPDYGLEHSPGYLLMEFLTYFASPYQVNPLNFNPFKELLGGRSISSGYAATGRQTFHFRDQCRNGQIEDFRGNELAAEHVLASACLPLMMHAVKIEGHYYWDGSFTAIPRSSR